MTNDKGAMLKERKKDEGVRKEMTKLKIQMPNQ
jgi:hypothetical protein